MIIISAWRDRIPEDIQQEIGNNRADPQTDLQYGSVDASQLPRPFQSPLSSPGGS